MVILNVVVRGCLARRGHLSEDFRKGKEGVMGIPGEECFTRGRTSSAKALRWNMLLAVTE